MTFFSCRNFAAFSVANPTVVHVCNRGVNRSTAMMCPNPGVALWDPRGAASCIRRWTARFSRISAAAISTSILVASSRSVETWLKTGTQQVNSSSIRCGLFAMQWRRQGALGHVPLRLPTISFLVHFVVKLAATVEILCSL